MRPQTVHFLAQLVRHSRGLVTTTEKWVAQTPPEAFAEEATAVVVQLRTALTSLERSLLIDAPRSSTAPPTTPDRPAAVAARSSGLGDRL